MSLYRRLGELLEQIKQFGKISDHQRYNTMEVDEGCADAPLHAPSELRL